MSTEYSPYWLTNKDIDVLRNLIIESINNKGINETFDGILIETNIASTRTIFSPIPVKDLTLALGFTNEHIPLYFTQEEKETIVNISNLPNTLKGAFK